MVALSQCVRFGGNRGSKCCLQSNHSSSFTLCLRALLEDEKWWSRVLQEVNWKDCFLFRKGRFVISPSLTWHNQFCAVETSQASLLLHESECVETPFSCCFQPRRLLSARAA